MYLVESACVLSQHRQSQRSHGQSSCEGSLLLLRPEGGVGIAAEAESLCGGGGGGVAKKKGGHYHLFFF